MVTRGQPERKDEETLDSMKRDPHIELAYKVIDNWPEWKKAVYRNRSPRIAYHKPTITR